MHSNEKVREVFALLADGQSQAETVRRVGVSRAQVRAWQEAGIDEVLASPMRLRSAKPSHDASSCVEMTNAPIGPYAYLLGQYLGDGCISVQAKGQPRLRISTCDDYPMIRDECIAAIHAVAREANVCTTPDQGCAQISAASMHWPCLFPQHGPGRKHERAITLENWQQRFALEIRPDLFVRGLVHSDGCRVINRVKAHGRRYEYVRYFFTNESTDIRWLFIDACHRLGVSARHNNRNSVSVARRDSVAILDRIVGPKR